MSRERLIGIIEILVSGVGFGFLGIFGKSAYAAGLTPGELLALRFLIASSLLALWLALFRRDVLRLTRQELVSSVLLGASGYAVFSSCYFIALKGLSASLTVLLLYTYPVVVTVGARLIFGEPLGPRARVALPLACAGLLMLIWGDFSVTRPAALLFGLGSSVFYSAYILASRRYLRGAHPFASALVIQAAAGITLGAIHLHDPDRLATLAAGARVLAPPVFGIAVVGTLFPITLFLSGLRRLTSAETSILSTAEPATAIIAAGLLLGERLSATQLLGGAAVILAMLLIVTTRAPSPPAGLPPAAAS